MRVFPELFPMTWHYFSWVDSSSLASCVPILGWKPHRWVRKGTPPIPVGNKAVWAALFNKESPCVPFWWKEFLRKSLMKINILLKWAFYLIPHQLAGKRLGGGKQISCWIRLTQTATWWMPKSIFASARRALGLNFGEGLILRYSRCTIRAYNTNAGVLKLLHCFLPAGLQRKF